MTYVNSTQRLVVGFGMGLMGLLGLSPWLGAGPTLLSAALSLACFALAAWSSTRFTVCVGLDDVEVRSLFRTSSVAYGELVDATVVERVVGMGARRRSVVRLTLTTGDTLDLIDHSEPVGSQRTKALGAMIQGRIRKA